MKQILFTLTCIGILVACSSNENQNNFEFSAAEIIDEPVCVLQENIQLLGEVNIQTSLDGQWELVNVGIAQDGSGGSGGDGGSGGIYESCDLNTFPNGIGHHIEYTRVGFCFAENREMAFQDCEVFRDYCCPLPPPPPWCYGQYW